MATTTTTTPTAPTITADAMAAPSPSAFKSRTVAREAYSRETPEGDGVLVRRSIGTMAIRSFDPFLLLDEMAECALPNGFPDHPHRGFETVTYMLPDSKGAFRHEDSVGHRGELHAGDLQWMTAGRGVMHSEMPLTTVSAHGLQLWVNLAAKYKMVPPAYQELKSTSIPETTVDGVHVRVIAGTSLGLSSPVKNLTPVHYLHFTLKPGAVLRQPIPAGWNAFIFTLRGECHFGPNGTKAPLTPAHTTLLLAAAGDGLLAEAPGSGDCEFLLISGQPLQEPVAHQGPFVMNTREELAQAFKDFYEGRNGFEGAANWHSSGSS